MHKVQGPIGYATVAVRRSVVDDSDTRGTVAGGSEFAEGA